MTTYRFKGFSLIEVLIAVAIVGTMIVATSALLQRVPIDAREVRDQDLALKIARDKLGQLRTSGYVALPASGSFSHTLLASLASSTGSVAIVDFNAKTKKVTTSVAWRGADLVMRSVSLITLVTQTGGLP